jgi:hypothetical protein
MHESCECVISTAESYSNIVHRVHTAIQSSQLSNSRAYVASVTVVKLLVEFQWHILSSYKS